MTYARDMSSEPLIEAVDDATRIFFISAYIAEKKAVNYALEACDTDATEVVDIHQMGAYLLDLYQQDLAWGQRGPIEIPKP